MTARGTFSVKIYCLCGASMKGSGAGDLSVADELGDIFWHVHHGDGHGATDAKTAAAARRKQARIRV